MPPVNTSASPTDVDNDATAELPVLDVAAYESAQSEQAESRAVPPVALTPVPTHLAEATAEMPGLKVEAIPTLQASTPAAPDPDHSGTHEMPALRETRHQNHRKTARPAAVSVAVPPSPPLIEELRGALASAERRIEELSEHARIASTERAVAVARVSSENAQLREQLAVHVESLHTARQRLSVQNADLPALEDQLFARADRIAALETELAAKAAAIESQLVVLTENLRRCESLECDLMNLRATVERRNAQIAILEADMGARQRREVQLKQKLDEALASTDPHVPRLRSEVSARDEEILMLKAEVEQARAQLAEKDQDLEVAEESIRNLEIEVRDKTGKLQEASATVDEWRAVIAESQRSILQRDHRIQQLESDIGKRIASTDSAGETGEEVALEGPARLLIRTDGNTDYVHVLGRRTRIGRGSDNELVLETKHVSRHHAVLLAGPTHTSIEDMNSTNGVFVNGKRVARQVLKDGDRVIIGRTQFRYCVRD
jgi:DNA repair exonuclease SbcCD ATPase subunit